MSQTISTLTGPVVALDIDTIQTQHGFMMGKMLTLAEAAFSDKEQRKAFKDIVRSAFNDQANWLNELAWGPGSSTGTKATQGGDRQSMDASCGHR